MKLSRESLILGLDDISFEILTMSTFISAWSLLMQSSVILASLIVVEACSLHEIHILSEGGVHIIKIIIVDICYCCSDYSLYFFYDLVHILVEGRNIALVSCVVLVLMVSLT